MSTSAELKFAARTNLRQALHRMSPEARAEGSTSIRAQLALLPGWTNARTLLVFVPTRHEPDIWPCVLSALRSNKVVCLPRFDTRTNGYVTCQLHNPNEDLAAGLHGIPEPREHCPVIDRKQLDLALVPGVGFSPSGGRLGRGKGFFDRLLSEIAAVKCGLAFDQQVVPELPMEPHDVRMDLVITPTRCFSINDGKPV